MGRGWTLGAGSKGTKDGACDGRSMMEVVSSVARKEWVSQEGHPSSSSVVRLQSAGRRYDWTTIAAKRAGQIGRALHGGQETRVGAIASLKRWKKHHSDSGSSDGNFP